MATPTVRDGTIAAPSWSSFPTGPFVAVTGHGDRSAHGVRLADEIVPGAEETYGPEGRSAR